jgi:hypothetical protein
MKSQSKKEQAIRELEISYSYRESVLNRDQHLFFEEIADYQEETIQVIRQWLNSYRDLLIQSLKEAQQLSLHHMRTIDQYFGNRSTVLRR